MPGDFEAIIESFPDALLSIRSDGPPTYRGENPHRIIVAGNPNAFRMFAQLLNMMADTVEQRSDDSGLGWNFVVGTETIPQLQMDEGHLLSLVCDPDTVATK
ncbi:MAG: hypothetical protein JWM11_2105 [Planctomycetaceae bacterium]|nr:hypothetical protein [Planctomycetaceae bacterium]